MLNATIKTQKNPILLPVNKMNEWLENRHRYIIEIEKYLQRTRDNEQANFL